MIERKCEYIQVNVYNQMEEIFIKNWRAKRLLGLDVSEDTPKFTNYDISESNMKCTICIT